MVPRVDDCHEHRHANKNHEEHEHEEGERTENWMRIQQFSGVELHQQHLEQHLRRLQQRGAGPDLRHKQHVKQTHESEHHHREHHHEVKQITSGVLEGVSEQVESAVESRETQELDRRHKAAQAEKRGEHVLRLSHPTEIDESVAIRLAKHIAHLRHLSPAPHPDRHTRPRAPDQCPLHIRPEQPEISSSQLDQRHDLGHRQIDDERQIEQGAHQVEHRREAEQTRVEGEGLEATVAEHTAVGQELGCESDGRELSGVGVVETELDENGACLLVDPRESTEEGEILSNFAQATAELIEISSTAVSGVIAGVGVGVELVARSVDEGVADG